MLGEGRWVLFGRVVISNRDDDPQNFRAALELGDGAYTIDEITGRMLGGGHYIEGNDNVQSFSLQGHLVAEEARRA